MFKVYHSDVCNIHVVSQALQELTTATMIPLRKNLHNK